MVQVLGGYGQANSEQHVIVVPISCDCPARNPHCNRCLEFDHGWILINGVYTDSCLGLRVWNIRKKIPRLPGHPVESGFPDSLFWWGPWPLLIGVYPSIVRQFYDFLGVLIRQRIVFRNDPSLTLDRHQQNQQYWLIMIHREFYHCGFVGIMTYLF